MAIISTALSAETVFLNDGSIIKGKVYEETDKFIKVSPGDGEKITIKRKDLLRIIYTDMYIGRVKIKKRDGSVFEAFIVDEDRDSYIFRWKLEKNDEFTLPRSEILQISRLEPSSLKAETLKDRVNLTWESPFSKIKEYRIYINSGDGKYILAAVSNNEKCTLFGLKEDVPYTIIVRAVDIDGFESEPSNELNLILTNLKPAAPSGLTCDTIESSDGGSLTAELKWDTDSSGRKYTYRVYKLTNTGEILAGETAVSSYRIYALSPESINAFYVTAVDTNGLVSDRSMIVYTRGSVQQQISTGMTLLVPFGRLGEMSSAGYGITLSYSAENIFINYLRLTAAAGINYFITDTPVFDSIMTIPLTLNAGYSFYFTPVISITPELGAGISYNILRYDSGYKSPADVPEYSDYQSVRPVINTSASVRWRALADFEFSFHLGYSAVIDSAMYQYISASAAASYRFWENMMKKILIIISVLLSLSGCGESFDAAYDAFRSPLNSLPTVSIDAVTGWQTSPVNITGSASDSDNDPLTYSWSEVTSYGVTFADPASPATSVSFTGNASGDVAVHAVIRLTVSDGEDASYRDTTIQIYRNDVIFVTTDGTGSGNNPLSTLGSIADAISYAQSHAKSIVAIAAGTYEINSGIAMTEGVSLYGGYSAADWSRNTDVNESLIRDMTKYNSPIEGAANGVIISNDDHNTTKATVVNGITIEIGRGVWAAGISCYSTSGLTIKNCTVRSRTDGTDTNQIQQFGIFLSNCGEIIIEGCRITLGNVKYVTGNHVYSAGIILFNSGNVIINRNIIYPGQSEVADTYVAYSLGINTNNISNTSLTITNNIISSGISANNNSSCYSTGINLVAVANTYTYNIQNNTICSISPYNSTSSCIRLTTSSGTEIIENNILMAYGTTLSCCILMNSSHTPDSLRNNLFFINTPAQFNAFVSSNGILYKTITENIPLMGTTLFALGNTTETLTNYLADYDGPDNDIVTLGDNDWHIVKSIHTPMNLLYGGIDLTASVPYDYDGNPRTNADALKATNANAGGLTIGAYEED